MNRRIRIVHIIPSLSTGGAEVTLGRLVEQPSSVPIEHSIVTLAENGTLATHLEQRGAEVVELREEERSPITTFQTSLRTVRHLRPDIIHAWMYHANLLAGPIGRLLRVPTIWSLRMSADPRGMKSSTWRIARLLSGPLQWLPSQVVACSEEVAATHRAIGLRRHIEIVENGYLTGAINQQQRADARSHYSLPSDAVVIGRPARWDPAKDHTTLLQALASLASEHPAVILLLAGRRIDGENRDLIAQVEQLRIRSNIRLAGEERDMLRFYAACDLVCSSSVTEGFPNVLAEAMALGLPVVATDAGASARIVGDRGWVVPTSSPTRLEHALRDAVTMDAEERRELGRMARRRIADHFGIEQMVRNYERIYSRLVSR